MYPDDHARQRITDRGPRFAVYGKIRRGEARTEYADTAERAEQTRADFTRLGYTKILVHPPVDSVELAPLRQARNAAQHKLNEATAILRAAVIRAINDDHRSESEVSREAGVDRMTVRRWLGKKTR